MAAELSGAVRVALTRVSSSNVSHLGHDGGSVLRVRYHSGHEYEVDGVTQAAYQSILGSPSIGRAVRAALDGRRVRRVR